MKSRTWIFVGLLIVALIFAYLVRVILTPFILAGIVAYVLNPVIKFIEKNLHLSRFLSVLLVYLIIFGLLLYSVFWLGGKLISEISDLKLEVIDFNSISKTALARLPEWNIAGQSVGFQSIVQGFFVSLNATVSHAQTLVLPIFSSALNRILQVLVFLVSTFYFLKDGPKFVASFREIISKRHQVHLDELLRQINEVLGGYLRGQILLVIIMGVATSALLMILGVRFALILGVLTGFLELIPFIGPIVAGGLAATTSYIVGSNRWGFDPSTLAVVIVLFYFLFRQIEDYFVVPQLMGRLTRLHPLVVLFAVLAGGRLAGPVGFILGVPVAAATRILFNYFWLRIPD